MPCSPTRPAAISALGVYTYCNKISHLKRPPRLPNYAPALPRDKANWPRTLPEPPGP
jgi:hypothetical protein